MSSLGPFLPSLLSAIVPLITLAALLVIWWKQRSVWLVVAIIAEAVGLVFRLVLLVEPGLVRDAPTLFALWSLSGFAFAIGLLGYAIEITQKKA